MSRLVWVFLSGLTLSYLTLIAACQSNSASRNDLDNLDDLPQDQFIQAYFNHRESRQTYIDPYRRVERRGDDLESVIIQAIDQANSSIDLAVQELNLPLIAQALAKSDRSGVRVRVILDNNYSRSLSSLSQSEIQQLNPRDRRKYSQFFQFADLNQDGRLSPLEINQRDALVILNQAGIPVIDDTADGSKGSGLMHHKFMVVDNKQVITGSTNFTLSGIHGDLNNPDTKGNVNHLLNIASPEVAALFAQEFAYMWGVRSGGSRSSQFGLDKPRRSPVQINWLNTSLTLQFAPTSTQKNWQFSTNGLIRQTIDQAQSSIDLALFVFSEQSLADALEQKQGQGVSVRGVFDADFAFRSYSEVLDMLGLTLPSSAIASAGNPCQIETGNNPWIKPLPTVGTAKLSPGDKLHHKFSLIDDKTIISGSQNWSQAGNRRNDEAVIVIKNSTVAGHFKQEFERLYQSAHFKLPPRLQSKIYRRQQCNH